ncbi:MAG: helix-turn-helix domain-containing protein [Pseudomonadales bacterium]
MSKTVASETHDAYIAATLRRARRQRGLSLRALAERAATSHATLAAYERGRKSPGAATLLRVLEACGYGIDIELSPRIRSRDGLARGKELQQVLELAEQFPARVSRTLNAPRFGQDQ